MGSFRDRIFGRDIVGVEEGSHYLSRLEIKGNSLPGSKTGISIRLNDRELEHVKELTLRMEANDVAVVSLDIFVDVVDIEVDPTVTEGWAYMTSNGDMLCLSKIIIPPPPVPETPDGEG